MQQGDPYRSSKKYVRRLTAYYMGVAPAFDVEGVHDLRTTTKQYRALLRWAGSGKNKLPRRFRQLYKIAGEIRNAQVLLQNLEKEGKVTPGLREWLEVHLALLEGSWSYHCREDILRRLKKKSKKYDFKRVDGQVLNAFVADRERAVRQILLDPTVSDSQLHEVRKLYKDMHFAIAWFNGGAQDGKERDRQLHIKHIGELAGDYNDRRMGLALLRRYQRQWQARGDEIVAAVIRDWEIQKNAARQELLNAL